MQTATPGATLDRQCATAVLGWRFTPRTTTLAPATTRARVLDLVEIETADGTRLGAYFPDRVPLVVPHFSTILDDAWDLVDAMLAATHPAAPFAPSFQLEYLAPLGWLAAFVVRADHPHRFQETYWTCQGDTPAHAIALAALHFATLAPLPAVSG